MNCVLSPNDWLLEKAVRRARTNANVSLTKVKYWKAMEALCTSFRLKFAINMNI